MSTRGLFPTNDQIGDTVARSQRDMAGRPEPFSAHDVANKAALAVGLRLGQSMGPILDAVEQAYDAGRRDVESEGLRPIHAMLDQAGIRPGSVARRIACALEDLNGWMDRADALAVERFEANAAIAKALDALARMSVPSAVANGLAEIVAMLRKGGE